MRVLGVVPARGGSKGVPRKNLAAVDGRPLIAYTLDAARQATLLTRCVVSTDDDEIASVARSLGGDVPFMRPPELATDSALTLPVVRHALDWAEQAEGARYDAILLLQPTTPLRSAEDIDRGIAMLADSDADSVVSIVDVGGNHPFRMKRLLDDGSIVNYLDQGFEDMRPRQQLPPVYIRSGSVYVVRRSVLVEQQSLVGKRCRGLVMPADRSVNIDVKTDLYVAERLLAARRAGS